MQPAAVAISDIQQELLAEAALDTFAEKRLREPKCELAMDSALEEARFEILVPPKEKGRFEDANLLERWYVFTRHRAVTELVLGCRSDAE
jgi:hypothetical protein